MQTLIALLLNKINLVLVYPKLQKCILDHLYFQNKIVFSIVTNPCQQFALRLSIMDNKIHVIEHVILLSNCILKMPQL